MILILPLILGLIKLGVIGQDADEVDELFDPWKDNCESMNPGNFTNSTLTPRSPPMPYEVTLSRTRITSQQGVYLTLAAPGALTFQGFMVHALDPGSGEATGQFDTQSEDVEVFTCFGHKDSSAMHVNETSKRSVKLRWVPEDKDVSSYSASFYVTVAETVHPLKNFWVQQKVGSVDIVKAPHTF